MELDKAITLSLGELNQPVITRYDLGVLVFRTYRAKAFKGTPIEKIPRDIPSNNELKNIENRLESIGVIKPEETWYAILGKKNYEPGEIVCSVDPFVYISHLSAMEFHGLTDRIPSSLFVSSPDPRNWKSLAKLKMEKDYEGLYQDYISSYLPKLARPSFNKIGKYQVDMYSSKHVGAGDFRKVSEKTLRVATIGRVFLDMVREPIRCGGIRHVIDVYKNHGPQYKNLIIDELDQHGNKIEKVRVGYLLEEICKLKDERIERWQSFVARGGSRKLDPAAEYRPVYSERWCLSINVDL